MAGTFDPTKYGATPVASAPTTPPPTFNKNAPSFDPASLGATPYTPAPVDNAATGIGKTVVDWSYSAAKTVTQAIDAPFLAALGVPREYFDALTGNKEAAQEAQTSGYDYGDFFGKMKPLGAGYDPTKSITDTANLRTIADTAGLALEGAAYAINPEVGLEGSAGVTSVKAAEGFLPKVIASGTALAKSGLGKFSAAQGASQGLESFGQGNTPGGAVTTGVVSGVLSAAFMKTMDIIGTPMKKSLGSVPGFITSAIKTKAGDAFAKILDGIGKTIQEMSDNPAFKNITEVMGDTAKTFRTNYSAAQSQLNNGLMNFLGGLRKNLTVPKDQEGWVKAMMDKSYGAFRAMDNAKEAEYNKVYNSGLTLSGAPKLEKGVADILRDIGGDAPKVDHFPNVKDPEVKAQLEAEMAKDAPKGEGLAPDLRTFISQLQERILNPVKAGAGFGIKEGNIFKNFISASGSDAEKAMADKLKALFHQDIADGLKTMGAKGKKALETLDRAGTMAKNVRNIKDSEFGHIFADVKNAKTVAQAFIDGGILKDSSQVKDLETLIGPVGIGQLRQVMMHTAFSNAIDMFKEITTTSLPAEFDAARKAAVGELDKVISAAEGRINLKSKGFQPFSAQQMKWLTDARQFIQGANMEDIARGYGLPSPGDLAAKSDALERAKNVFESKTPVEIANTIAKMTNLDDIKAAMSFLPEGPKRAAVGAQVLKNFVNGMTTAFRGSLNTEEFGKLTKKILSIGDNREAYEAIFGKGTATDNLVREMNDASTAFEAFAKDKNPASLERAANAAMGVMFYTLGHPIMATGSFLKASKGLGKAEVDTFKELTGKTQEELVSMLEKDGEIQPNKLGKMWRTFGKILTSRVAQLMAGHEAAKSASGGVDDTQPSDSNQ